MSFTSERILKINSACYNDFVFDVKKYVADQTQRLIKTETLNNGNNMIITIEWEKCGDMSYKSVNGVLYDKNGNELKRESISDNRPVKRKSLQVLVALTKIYNNQVILKELFDIE